MAVKKKTTTKKAPAKKAPAKKAAVKKAAPKAAAPAKVAPKKTPIPKFVAEKQTKTQIITAISDDTGLSKKDVGAVFSALSALIGAHMSKKGSGELSIPEAGVKIRRVKKPATKARKMISPFTGEQITVKAKPARNTVKIAALKSLKDSV